MISITIQGTTIEELKAGFILIGQAFAEQARISSATEQLKKGTDVLQGAIDNAPQP